MTKRRPSAEESELFRRAVGDARPLRARAKRAAPPPAREAKPAPEPKPKPPAPRIALPIPPRVPRTKPPRPGQFADIDKRTAERFRRGEIAIEARLDLHGLTQAEAHRRLDGFVARAAAAGTRMLLVITGKGERGRDGRSGGVLRDGVPRWLAEPGLRPYVLALSHAQPKHGGGGALYVLLRKKREDRR